MREQYQQMLRTLLEERFKLNVHRETRDLPAYELLLTKTGSSLKAAEPRACEPAGANGNQNGVKVQTRRAVPSSQGNGHSMAEVCP
jgi:uncharacterized protein (TIGR03435 family)